METIHYLHSPGKTTFCYFLHTAGHIKCNFLYLVALIGIYFEEVPLITSSALVPLHNSYNGAFSTMLIPIGMIVYINLLLKSRFINTQ